LLVHSVYFVFTLFAVFKPFLSVEEKYRTLCLVASSTQYNLLTSAYTGFAKFGICDTDLRHMWGIIYGLQWRTIRE